MIWTAANQGNQASQRLNSFTFLAQGSPGEPDAAILHSALTMFMAADKLSTQVVCRRNRTGNQASQRLISFTFLAQGSLGKSDAAVPRSARPMLMATGQSVEYNSRSARPMLMATGQSLCPAHAYGHRTVSTHYFSSLPGEPDKLLFTSLPGEPDKP